MIPRTITKFDKREHFGARFLHIYNENKKLNFAVDLAKLDQKGKKGQCVYGQFNNYFLEFYFWQSIIREVKTKGRPGVLGEGNVGYVRLDINKATNNQPNALSMNFPLQESR